MKIKAILIAIVSVIFNFCAATASNVKFIVYDNTNDKEILNVAVEAFYYDLSFDSKGIPILGSLSNGVKINSILTNKNGKASFNINTRHSKDYFFIKLKHKEFEEKVITLIKLEEGKTIEKSVYLNPKEPTEQESIIIEEKFLEWKSKFNEVKRNHIEKENDIQIDIPTYDNLNALILFDGNSLSVKNLSNEKIKKITEGLYPNKAQVLKKDHVIYKGDRLNAASNNIERFVSGLQSPYNSSSWLYTVIENRSRKSKLLQYDSKSKTVVKVKIKNANESWTYNPIAFLNDEQTIIVEAANYYSQEEHLGIFKLNLANGQLSAIEIIENYGSTPLLSADGETLYYSVLSDDSKDHIHGHKGKIYSYNLTNKIESIFHQSNNQLKIIGFTDSNIQLKTVEQEEYYSEYNSSSMLSYYLPFDNGQDWCVTRDGMPRPPVSSLNNNNICYYGFGQHSYEAIDFTNLDMTNAYLSENIRAVADGTVIHAGATSCNCGYGNLVKIQHANGHVSFYAHLASVAVAYGDCVVQGELIGNEGATGSECGDCTYYEHTHFEMRASDADGTQIWIHFAEYGETPRQNDYVVSGNVANSCLNSPPIGGNACSITVPTGVYVTNLVNGYNGSTNGNGYTGYINFNDYVAGVIEGEIGGITSNAETKKAQAVGARSFSFAKHQAGSSAVNIGQAYSDAISGSSTNASNNTNQEVITYNGVALETYYAARCNGDYTQNSSEGTWDPYNTCNTSGNYLSTHVSVACSGHSNCSNIQGENPCCAAINSTTNSWGHIFGHGVGMCQRGIEQYGELYGWTYCSMLKHYYNGICIANSSCSVSAANDNLDCSNAVSLSCNVAYTGSYSSQSSNVGAYGCTNWTETGPERVHTFVPTVDGTITATISNFSGDLDVFILGSCNPSNCLGSVSSTQATYANAIAGETYYIVVDADDGSGSAYDLLASDGVCASGPTNDYCDFTIYNNTNCNVLIEWWTGTTWTFGSSISPYGVGVDYIQDGWFWLAINSEDGSELTNFITSALCADGSASIDASLCYDAPSNSNCNFTIYNNTSCDIFLNWFDGVNVTQGASIPAYGSVIENIEDGNMWAAYNAIDGTAITDFFSNAYCSDGFATVFGSLCEAAPSTCYFTIYNNTDCSISLQWWNGSTWYIGSNISANSFVSEQIEDGYFWQAFNQADGLAIDGNIYSADCSTGSASIAASSCSNAPPPLTSCNFTITNNTNCNVYLGWYDGVDFWNGATIPAYGSATEYIDDGDLWAAYNADDGSVVTPYYNSAFCSAGSDYIPASNCIASPPQTNNCNFTITNNTNCSVYIGWYDGVNFWNGATIPPFGSATEYIEDGNLWAAYNSNDGGVVTPYYSQANCSSGSDFIPASLCNEGPSPISNCIFTITNNTNCDVYIGWYDGVNFWNGASIPVYGSITEYIDDGDLWAAYNSIDGSIVTPYYNQANCSSGSDIIPASDCNQVNPPVNNCNFTITNNTNCDVYIGWYDGFNFWNGTTIPALSSATENITDGDLWAAYNLYDGSVVTPTYSVANCSANSDFIPASYCNTGTSPTGNCNFTIVNNTNCDIYTYWYDGINFWQGASIAGNSSVTELIENGNYWSAYNSADGSLITPFFESAECANGFGIVDASLCNSAQNCISTFQDGNINYSMNVESPDFIISPSTGSNFEVNAPNGQVVFDANNFIELNSGFEVALGAEFSAVIDGCDGQFLNNNNPSLKWSIQQTHNDIIIDLKEIQSSKNNITIEFKDAFGITLCSEADISFEKSQRHINYELSKLPNGIAFCLLNVNGKESTKAIFK